MKAKRTISVMLIVFLIFSLVIGCKNTGSSDNSNGSNTTAAAGKEDTTKKVVLYWMIPTQQGIPLSETKVYQEACKELNIEFEITELPVDQHNEQKKLKLSGKNLPDIISWVTTSEANTYGPEGAFVDLSKYIASDIPNLKEKFDKYPQDKYAAFNTENKLYMAPQYLYDPVPIFDFSINKARFDEVGATKLDTWTEVYNALKALKAKYPQSYPLSFRYFGGLSKPMELFISSFTEGKAGPHGDFVGYDYDKKQFIFSLLAPGYKESVEFFGKLLKEGLIHPEYMTMDQGMQIAKINKNEVFMIADFIGGWSGLVSINNDTNRVLVPLQLPQAEGKRRILDVQLPHIGTTGTAINSSLETGKDVTKFKRALKFLNYMYSQKEFDTLWYNPDVCDKQPDNTYKYKDIVYDSKAEGYSTMVNTYFPWSLMQFQDICDERPQPGGAYDLYLKNVLRAKKDLYVDRPSVPFDASQQDKINKLNSAIKNRYNSTISKFVDGKMSMTEWSAFVADLQSAGADELVKIYNDQNTKMNSK
jgi:putative aldouronate transport system substrate-binding protein